MSEPIRIFIGTSANNEDSDAEMVLEYSLRKNSSRELMITWMRQTHDESSIWGGWQTQRWSTPFSGFRWAIPEACGFSGRAIYMDVDQVNLRDIADLYNTPLQGRPCAARPGVRFGGHEFCVMLIDCAAMGEILVPVSRMKPNPDAHHRYIAMFSGNPDYVLNLDARWIFHDGDNDLVAGGRLLDDIWHLHYTKMATQPWKPVWFKGKAEEHPRKDLTEFWFKMRDEALANGKVPLVRNDTFGEYNIIGQ